MRETHFEEDRYLQERYGEDELCNACDLYDECQEGQFDSCFFADDVIYDEADRKKHDDKVKELRNEKLR